MLVICCHTAPTFQWTTGGLEPRVVTQTIEDDCFERSNRVQRWRLLKVTIIQSTVHQDLEIVSITNTEQSSFITDRDIEIQAMKSTQFKGSFVGISECS